MHRAVMTAVVVVVRAGATDENVELVSVVALGHGMTKVKTCLLTAHALEVSAETGISTNRSGHHGAKKTLLLLLHR